MIWDVYYILNLSQKGDNCSPSNTQKTYAYERFQCQKIRDFFLELGQKGTCVTFKFVCLYDGDKNIWNQRISRCSINNAAVMKFSGINLDNIEWMSYKVD